MFKVKNEKNVDLMNPIRTVFLNNNISEEDIKWFTNPKPFEHDPLLLENMDEAYKLIIKHIKNKRSIHVQVDLDLDGLTSSAILINYLTRVFPDINITWSNHSENIKHGIEIDLIPSNTSLLIVPDAGTNEYEKHKQVVDMGIDILILDHHMAEKYSEHAVTVNNQLCDYPNKNLSGAGIVFKFIEYIDSKKSLSHAEEFLDLCAFGLTGDAMLQSDKETKWLVTQGLNNIKNEFLRELIKENVDDGVQLTPNVLSFKCNPKVNSLIRVGTKEEQDDLFKALIGHQEVTINPRLRKADKSETWARKMVRTANNTYSRQRRIKESLLSQLENKIEIEKLHENAFMVVEIDEDFNMPMNMSGYIASFLVSKYRKPTLVLRKDDEDSRKLVGSMRGYDLAMKDTRNFLRGLQLFDLVEGHNQASGVKIEVDNFKLLDDKINEALNHTDEDKDHLVDMVLPASMVNADFIKEIEKYSYIWAKGIEAGSFAVKGIEVNLSDAFIMGKTEDMIKMSVNSVEFVKFSGISSLFDLKKDNKTVILNVVGKTGMNSWKGNLTPQFVIEDYEIVEVKDSVKFVF